MKVEEIMTKNPVFLHDTDFMTHARQVVRDQHKRTLPVVDNKNRLIGILTEKDILKIIEESSKLASKPGTVLVPRNIRRLASGFILNKATYVSTNFVEVLLPDRESGLLFLLWVLSIFGQLQFELLAQDQEGARKIEKEQTESIKIPNFATIPDDYKKKIINAIATVEFLDFYNMRIRPIDILWGEAVFASLAVEKVNEAKALLEELILERDPQ